MICFQIHFIVIFILLFFLIAMFLMRSWKRKMAKKNVDYVRSLSKEVGDYRFRCQVMTGEIKDYRAFLEMIVGRDYANVGELSVRSKNVLNRYEGRWL